MKFLSVSLLTVLLVTGCNYQVKKSTGSDAGNAPTSKPEVALYFADVQPILDRACVKCHEEFASYEELMSSDSVHPGDAANSDLYTSLQNVGGKMPKRAGPIPDADAALIRDWINGGALLAQAVEPAPKPEPQPTEPAPQPEPQPLPIPSPNEPAPVPEPALATYTQLQAQVFSKKCNMCHGDTSRSAGFSLEHYSEIVSNARLVVKGKSDDSGLYVSVAGPDAFMPPKRAVSSGRVQPLTQEEKDALKAWIDAGAPEN